MYNHKNYFNVPKRTLNSLDNWAKKGMHPGGFCSAVLENNLKRAVGQADGDNIKVIPDIVKYVHNELPRGCWGSPEAMNNWFQRKKDKT